jgi:sterol desaturase/sphingolipid hydroxylase (fatty acid hydroxylase superfamily)
MRRGVTSMIVAILLVPASAQAGGFVPTSGDGALMCVTTVVPLAVWIAWKLASRSRRPWVRHLFTNVSFGLFNATIAALVTAPTISSWNALFDAKGFGLLRWLGVDGAANVIVSFVLLDLLAFVRHRLFHRVPLLWRFHAVHHTERDLGLGSTYRAHAGELLIGGLKTTFAAIVIGPSLLAFVVHEIVDNVWSQYQHTNVHLPRRVDAIVSRVLMTSAKHAVHHSCAPHQTGSNYASVFAWDRLFGTFRDDDPKTIVTGLDRYPSPLGFWDLLVLPFRAPASRRSDLRHSPR